MFKKRKTVLALSLLYFMANSAIAYDFKENENLNQDLNLNSSYNYIDGNVTITGNKHSINGNNNKGLTINNKTELNIIGVGDYTTSSTAPSDIALKYIGNKIEEVKLGINHDGVKNFDGKNGSFITTSANKNVQLKIENSVVHGNKYSSSSGVETGAVYGGAIYILSNKNGDSESFEEATTHSINISNSYFTENKLEGVEHTLYGGAIWSQLNHGSVTIEGSYFTNNTIKGLGTTKASFVGGGAIYNASAKLNVKDTYFGRNKVENYSASGGAFNDTLYASQDTQNSAFEAHNFINTIFEENSVKATGGSASGGALVAGNSTNLKNVLFKNNSANAELASFKKGAGSAIGGALYQSANRAETTMNNVVFDNNSVTNKNASSTGGGAVYQLGDDFVSKIENSTFKNNSINSTNGLSSKGGAIAQYGDRFKTEISNTTFSNNKIVNNANISGAGGDPIETAGGAIYFEGATSGTTANPTVSNLNLNNVTFKQNSIESNSFALGGAIAIGDHNGYPSSTIANVSNSTFDGNSVNALASSKVAPSGYDEYNGGGAIYNGSYDVFNINNSNFNGNKFTSAYNGSDTEVLYGGGAIYNQGYGITTLTDTSFTNNESIGKSTSGGAIYNAKYGVVNIISKNKDVIFSGNKAGANSSSLASNAIYDAIGTINLNAAQGRKIIFNDSIATADPYTRYGKVYQTKININMQGEYENSDTQYQTDMYKNKLPVDAPYGENAGTVVINSTMKDFKGAINLYGGTLQLGQNGEFFNNANEFNVEAPSRLNLANNKIQKHNFNDFKLNSNLKMSVDADLNKGEIDTISAKSINVANNSKINIEKVNVVADMDATSENASFKITDNDDLYSVITLEEDAKTTLGKIFKYDVELNDDTKEIALTKSGIVNTGGGQSGQQKPSMESFNPAVMVGAVASQVGYYNQLNSYDYAFQNTISEMMIPGRERQIAGLKNRYAIKEAKNVYYDRESNSAWFKPYASFEDVDLKGGLDVDNIMYGTFIGTDSHIINLKNGKKLQLSGYLGYNGSHQTFDSNSMYQNGGLLGTTAALYRRNFFTAITANAGASMVEASTMFGKDDFPMFMTGVASTTGYNMEFKEGKFVIQPNFMISYSFVNTFNFTNKAGVKITSDPLHAIQISPGMRIYGNTVNGWQPYISAAMKWNILDKSNFMASTVALPELSTKPYVEYGIGLQKRGFKDNVCGYLQSMIRNGGRTGVALTFGLDVLVGRDNESL